MYAEERQRMILERARAAGRVDVADLAGEFHLTYETVRRDLTALERHGVLRRVHGGAIPIERLGFEPSFGTRDSTMTEEKERIAKAALAEVPADGAILLDAGSTTGRLAEQLPADRELTVVTNSLTIAFTLSARPNVQLMVVGGRLRGRTLATVESWALQALQDTFVEVAFVGTNGVSVERGMTTPDQSEAMTKRAAIRSARRTVLLADHTKVGNDHFARVEGLKEVDTFVTDNGVDSSLVNEIEAAGPAVVVV
ncbi:DeoR/GlpR family DNA-binding transcription regulator [Actinopolyspora biskrensis]|nr:DeoR/GlpR family DNA-binding transcription regulator [Actinopolyspora biskrensis]